MDYLELPVRHKVIWSLKEWQRRDDILVSRKLERRPMAREDRLLLMQVADEREAVSWSWSNRA